MKITEDYKSFIKGELKKADKSLGKMSDEETKAFFASVDTKWKAQNESINEAGITKGVTVSKDGYVKNIKHPMTGKKVKEVTVDGMVYRFNPVYKTYNSVKNNGLLNYKDVSKIRYNESINEAIKEGDIKYKWTHNNGKDKKKNPRVYTKVKLGKQISDEKGWERFHVTILDGKNKGKTDVAYLSNLVDKVGESSFSLNVNKEQLQEFNKLHGIILSELRSVKVTYDNGVVIPTSMAANLTDKQIRDYFKIGKTF